MNDNKIKAIILVRRVAKSNEKIQILGDLDLLTEDIVNEELEKLILTDQQANTNVLDLDVLSYLITNFEIENVFNMIEKEMIRRLGVMIIDSE